MTMRLLAAFSICMPSCVRLVLLVTPLVFLFAPHAQAEYKLLVSGSADRSSPAVLGGNAVYGSIHVFVSPETDIDQVRFALNGQPVRTEFLRSYDFAATAPDGTAYPFDSASLPDGVHTISALISRTSGRSETVTATFTVANGSPLYDLLVSTAPDRSKPVTLNGQTVFGDIFVFVSPERDIKQVEFRVDGIPVRTEHKPGFDLAATASANLARPFDLTQFADGPHTVTAEITLENGTVVLATSTFVNVGLHDGTGEIAAQVELNWVPPNQRSDGTALSLSEVGGYILQMNGRVLSDDIPGDAVTLTVDIMAAGEYCFKMATRDSDGRVGPYSPAECWTVFPAPGV